MNSEFNNKLSVDFLEIGPYAGFMSEPRLDARIVRTRNDVLQAAIDVLIDEGWDAVTQPHVARVAGYSKATVYAHWPDRLDLLRDAFMRFKEMPHHEPVGDLREDVVGELRSYRRALVEFRLDRALVALAERAMTTPEVVEIRDAFVDDGTRVIRRILEPVAAGTDHEAAVALLSGAMLHSMLLTGVTPDDETIEAYADITLRGLGVEPA